LKKKHRISVRSVTKKKDTVTAAVAVRDFFKNDQTTPVKDLSNLPMNA
jgi:hypothetical protein